MVGGWVFSGFDGELPVLFVEWEGADEGDFAECVTDVRAIVGCA